MSNHEPYGLLGKAFYYTRDDLNANRAGMMTLAQELEFKFWERKLYSGLLTIVPFKWFLGEKRREAIQITGKVKKYFSSRVIFIEHGRSGGGTQLSLEKRTLEFITPNETVTFYVNDKQYNSLPENIEMTLYYDKMDYRILSVEPPYAEK